MIRRTNGASWKRTIAWIVTKPYRLRQWPVGARMSLGISKIRCWWEKNRRSPVDMVSLSHDLRGFSHYPRWLVRISSVNSMEVVKAMLPTLLNSNDVYNCLMAVQSGCNQLMGLYIYWIAINCGDRDASNEPGKLDKLIQRLMEQLCFFGDRVILGTRNTKKRGVNLGAPESTKSWLKNSWLVYLRTWNPTDPCFDWSLDLVLEGSFG